MSLRKVLKEAVFKRGDTKYMSRSGKYYSYDKQNKRTEISKEEYEKALGSKTPSRPRRNPTTIKMKQIKGKETGTTPYTAFDMEKQISRSVRDLSKMDGYIPLDVEVSNFVGDVSGNYDTTIRMKHKDGREVPRHYAEYLADRITKRLSKIRRGAYAYLVDNSTVSIDYGDYRSRNPYGI